MFYKKRIFIHSLCMFIRTLLINRIPKRGKIKIKSLFYKGLKEVAVKIRVEKRVKIKSE